MSTMYTWNSLTDWHILPITQVSLAFADGAGTLSHVIANPVKGSNFALEPIMAKVRSNNGGDVCVGFKLTSTVVLPQNNIKDLQPLFNDINSRVLTGIIYDLSQDEQLLFEISTAAGTYSASLSATFSIVYSDEFMGPEVQIKIMGTLGKNIINDTNFSNIFIQNIWGI